MKMKIKIKIKIKIKLLLLLIILVSFGVFNSIPVKAQDTPTITVFPPAGPPGIPVTVTGTDFTPNATVDLDWFGFIVDTPDVNGHIDYYPIKTGVTVGTDGKFTTTIIAPYDFSDFVHFINATQNGEGLGTLASFVIVPTLQLSPLPANYTEGQEVFLNVYGAPLGFLAIMMDLPTMAPESSVLKLNYDNYEWGFATSHLETEVPITLAGDLGGNATIRFKAVGGVGKHYIRGYTGGKESHPYLLCEVGGEVEFNIVGPGFDAQTILDSLATSLDATLLSIQGDTATIETSLGTISGTISTIDDGVATIQTDLGTMSLSVDGAKDSTDSAVNYGLGALGFSVVNLIILLAVGYGVFRKTR